MNVFALMHNDITGCEYYRIIQPLEALRRKGHNTSYMTAEHLVRQARQGKLPWLLADVILMNRLVIKKTDSHEVAALIDSMRRMNKGVRVIYDTDDDLTGEHRKVYPDDSEIPNLLSFDRVTVTTPALRDVMKKMHPVVNVVPNYVVVSNFIGHIRIPVELTISLTGSTTHRKDWETVIEPLNYVTDKYGCKVVVSGFVPDGLRNYYTLYALGLSNNNTVPFQDYPKVIAQGDIIVIPLDPSDRFNFSKSNVKALEAAASARRLANGRIGGSAIIAVSNPPIYTDFVRNERNGLLVQHSRQDQWVAALERMILDEQFRMRMQEQAFKDVLLNFNAYDSGALMYERTFDAVLKTPPLLTLLSRDRLSRYAKPHPTTSQ